MMLRDEKIKPFVILLIALSVLSACSTSKKITTDFSSQGIGDTILSDLTKYKVYRNENPSKVKWFALVRDEPGGFYLVINRELGVKGDPFRLLIKRTNRYIKIANKIEIPLIFEIDFSSDDFKKIVPGTVNFGGICFLMVKQGEQYKIAQRGSFF